MCAVSQVGDQFQQQWQGQLGGIGGLQQYIQQVSRQEFENLKQEVFKLRDELKAAKELDIKNKEPDCSHAHKVDLLRQFAKAFDVDLSDIFPDTPIAR